MNRMLQLLKAIQNVMHVSSLLQPENMDALMMWKLILDMLTDPKPREKLPHINTLDQALHLLATRKNILVLTGAGVRLSLCFKSNLGLIMH